MNGAARRPEPVAPGTLAWLLCSLALVVAPHLGHLAPWVSLTFFLLAGWCVLGTRRGAWLPGSLVLLAITCLATFAVLASHGSLLGRDAGVALLTVMLGLKLLELKALRDVYVAVFLGYFLVVTNFLYSQSIPTAVYMLVVVVALTATLIDLNHPGGARTVKPKLRLAATLLAQALPVMVVLFVLFPRVNGPLWGLPNDAHRGMTGLGEDMRMGQIGALSRSDAVAFRVSFAQGLPPPQLRYWRGPVLWRTDGRRWTRGRGVPDPGWTRRPRLAVDGPPLRHTVTLEPHNRRWLFALDLPVKPPPRGGITAAHQILARKNVTERIRYDVLSHPRYRTLENEHGGWRERALQLPAHLSGRVQALADRWRKDSGAPGEVVAHALRFFREQPFVYTLTPPVLGDDPVDEFLFGTRRGFCEHFAAAFTVLMRAAGVPARVVTGYQGGEVNPLGDYLIVRQSDAHAWSEVWLRSRGWVRVDPTAAVAPERVERRLDLGSGRAGEALGFRLPGQDLASRMWRRLGFAWDSANNRWNQWFLGYGPAVQRHFLSRFGFGTPTWQGMSIALLAAVGATVLGIAALVLLHRPQAADPALAAYQRFCAKLARRDIRRTPSEGPLDFARRVAGLRPDLAPRVRLITQLYVKLRYGPGERVEWLDRLRKLIRVFNP